MCVVCAFSVYISCIYPWRVHFQCIGVCYAVLPHYVSVKEGCGEHELYTSTQSEGEAAHVF